MTTPVVGSIVERKTNAPSSFKSQSTTDPKTGFPAVQHRSSSAFARSRAAARQKQSSLGEHVIPKVSPSDGLNLPEDGLIQEISRENTQKLGNMSLSEIEKERRELMDQHPEIVASIMRLKERREGIARGKEPNQGNAGHSHDAGILDLLPVTVTKPKELVGPRAIRTHDIQSEVLDRPPSRLKSALSRSSTPKTAQKLRFASGPDEVHVYESEPSSPRRPIALLPPPDPQDPSEHSIDVSNSVKLVQPNPTSQVADRAEEGTPEHIREKYFPSASLDDPRLQWMKFVDSKPISADGSPHVDRYDLQGHPIPKELQSSLPTHLGLHHHNGELAGYTIEDLLLLTRSTVPAQRASMLGILSKLLKRLSKTRTSTEMDYTRVVELRSKAFLVGVEALRERGSALALAVELVWVIMVKWEADKRTNKFDQDDTTSDDAGVTFSSIAPNALLVLIEEQINPKSRSLPHSSLCQLLEVILQMVEDSPDLAREIMNLHSLLPSILHTFIALPIGGEISPNPLAIRLTTLLAKSSREIARALIDSSVPDSFLRFVVIMPNLDELQQSVQHTLTSEALLLFQALGRYGLYSHTSTIAADALNKLTAYILQGATSRSPLPTHVVALMESWVSLLEVWITCATNPHYTSPPHDILWSQITAWDWPSKLLQLRERLIEGENPPISVLVTIWSALAAWMDGATINCLQNGKREKEMISSALQKSIRTEGEHFISARHELRGLVMEESNKTIAKASFIHRVSKPCENLHALVRLTISCCGSGSDPASVSESQSIILLALPISTLFPLCTAITEHSTWRKIYYDDAPLPQDYTLLRPATSLIHGTLIAAYQSLPYAWENWLAHMIQAVPYFLPGDTDHALQIMKIINDAVSKELIAQKWGWDVPDEVWSKGGIEVILPFLECLVQPTPVPGSNDSDEALKIIAPLVASPRSISQCTTQTNPSSKELHPSGNRGLPVRNPAWMFSPLNDLLRSGNSPVFKTLPKNWNYSEIDVARSVMLLAKVALRVTNSPTEQDHRSGGVIDRDAAILECMKVFMLEHEQGDSVIGHADSSSEVFRDPMVATYMEDILSRFKVQPFAGKSAPIRAPYILPSGPGLEKIAASFLGPTTPFFQFYSDFLGLYDSISFGHRTFGALLIPPLSMQYPTDYRKLLWGDYGHILRTLVVQLGDVIGDDPRSWLYPVEQDGEVLGFYLKALAIGRVDGFLHWVAVHHLASTLWPDLSLESGLGNPANPAQEPSNISRRKKVLMALVSSANPDAVKSIVHYHQSPNDLLNPPDCYLLPKDQGLSRWEEICNWGDKQLASRVRGLLLGS